jgi:ribose transport system permease protein
VTAAAASALPAGGLLRRAAGSDQAVIIASRLAGLALLVLALSLVSEHFLTVPNLLNVARQAALQFLVSAGLTLVVLTGGIDLSVGAVLGLAGCLAAGLIAGGSTGLGVLAALAAGLLCGAVNGLLVAYLRIPSFIATYGMLWIAHGAGYVFMRGEVIYGFPPEFRILGTGFLGPVPMPVVASALVLLVLHVLLHRTPFGRGVYAIGGNRSAAERSGMDVRRRLAAVYALSGLLAASAALVVIARINAADSGLGEDLLLPSIAAVCLGGTSLFGGSGGIAGTAVGAVILALVVNGMNLLGIGTLWQAGVMGAIIVLSVLADQGLGRRAAARG